jgi:SAM-dependent methyltransferase
VSIFENYAQYYDLLYRDKDYQQEADFVIQLVKEYAPQAHTILELGCGTGHHAEYLLKAGYQITGVERSHEMLKMCRQRYGQLGNNQQANMTIIDGDLRSLRLEKQFDVVLALFHVISYQSSNADLKSAFETVHQHLKPGGVFLFDIWYGPAVLTERPTPRIKRLQSPDYTITRFAQPTLHPNDNWVDVHYQIYAQDSRTHRCDLAEEIHRMRYLFLPELEVLCQNFSLKILDAGEWLSRKPLGFDTWSACIVVGHG